MTARQTWVAVVLTVAYLLVELAFNARLLDLVGAAASADELHRIEVCGRLLSSVAAGLLVWQLMLGRSGARAAAGKARYSTGLIAAGVVCAAAGTYVGIQKFVESQIARSSAEERRTYTFLTLVQKAMVDGRVLIDGLDGGKEVFAKPEGKAFLGVFPLMAASVDNLEAKVSPAVHQLVREQVVSSLGGPKGYYDSYSVGVHKIAARYKDYSKLPTPGQVEQLAIQKADEAWDDYVADLAKRGWTPQQVPYVAQGRVAAKVRSQIDVPRDWNTWEVDVFKDAVMRKVRATVPTSARFNGQSIPAGLSWPSFFAHHAIQRELREQMRVPDGIEVRYQYADAGQFQREIFNPVVATVAAQEIARFKAPVKTFEVGGSNYEKGITAAKAVIMPPWALGFSMLGAIGHTAKLAVLLLTLILATMSKPFPWWAKGGVAAGLVASAWLALSLMSNPVASSRLYVFLQKQVVATAPAAMSNALHVVAVGQSFMYPVNEGVRKMVLRGFGFGFEPRS